MMTPEAPAACAEREAHRGLFLPRRGARQQQARHVGARDQQHQADHAHQYQNRRRELLAEIRSPSQPRTKEQVFAQERIVKALRHAGQLLQLQLVDLTVDDVHGGFGLRR